MTDFAAPLAFAVLVWWTATAIVMFLDGLPRNTFRWTLLGVSVMQAAALYGLLQSRDDTSIAGAYLAFTCAVLTWGWQEVFFLTGAITGPRRRACAEGCSGWSHFGHGVQAILHHEFSLLVAGIVLVAIGWNAPNQVGMWTYLVLWGMRQSAKLNLFLGVRNVGVEFLPQHLAYLQSFFRRRHMNALFPLSIAAASALVIMLGRLTLDPGSEPHETSGYALLTAIALLGLLEHGLLMLPIPSAVLWQWGLKSHRRTIVVPQAAAEGKST
jgi:putative photosynthetic complex assembly protein 2